MRMRYSLLILTLLMSISMYGQNIVSGTYERSDNGFGLRYDRQFRMHDDHGMYIGGGYGVYLKPTMNAFEHVKVQAGYVRYFRNYAEPDWKVGFSAGINGHYYHEIDRGFQGITNGKDERALFPVSADLGVVFIICKRLSIGWTWDIIKSDCVFGAGYRFGIK
jgi:hypothetical protein